MKITSKIILPFFQLLSTNLIYAQSMETSVTQNNLNKVSKEFYDAVELKYYETKDATLAVKKFGNGPNIVLIHGFMVHGYTWRHLLPELSKQFTCYVVDLPGFGNSKWTQKTDFSFTAQANRLIELFKILNIQTYSLIGHDTGGSIARMIAISETTAVQKLVLFDTEIPNHKPPFIRFYQLSAYLPLSNLIFRTILKSKRLIKSKLLFKEFYDNKEYLNIPDNIIIPYLNPLTTSKINMKGALNYLKGIEWKTINNFKTNHKLITAKTMMLWGENDNTTFPIKYAKQMPQQFLNCEFKTIPKSKVMPHEENSVEVNKALLSFLLN